MARASLRLACAFQQRMRLGQSGRGLLETTHVP